MIGLNNKIYLVKIEQDDFREVVIEGKTIRIPNKFKGLDSRLQKAVVEIPNYKNDDLKKGDVVYCHHFLNDESAKKVVNGLKCYEMDINDIYLKIVDGEIKMLDEWLLVEPIVEEKFGRKFAEPNVGILKYGLDEYIDCKIAFEKNSDYELLVEDKIYYRIRKSDLLGVYS